MTPAPGAASRQDDKWPTIFTHADLDATYARGQAAGAEATFADGDILAALLRECVAVMDDHELAHRITVVLDARAALGRAE